MALSASERKERSLIIRDLCRLSHQGWGRRVDWEAAERCLDELNRKKTQERGS